MKKIAFVFGVGGAKCAFQAGAERYLREVKGVRPCKIAGNSGGGLNGAVSASPNPERLVEVWKSLTTEKVIGKRSTIKIIRRIIAGKVSLFENDRLFKIIKDAIDPSSLTIPLNVGAVSSIDGEYQSFPSTHPDFLRVLLASAALPPAFPPVDINPDFPAMIDGGVRRPLPLKDVIDVDPDLIIAIACSPISMAPQPAPKNALRYSQRGLELSMHESFKSYLSRFQLLNRLAGQTHGDETLTAENGRIYKRYPLVLIMPDARLGDVLDFSPKTIAKSIEAGWNKAEQVLSAFSFE